MKQGVNSFWWARSKHGALIYHAVGGGFAPWESPIAQCGVTLNRNNYLASRTDLNKIPDGRHACTACLTKVRGRKAAAP